MTNPKALTAAMLALLFLAACGSSGMGDILGGGKSTDSNYEIRGRVDYVDAANRTVTLTNVTGYNSSMLSSDGGSTVRVHFDDNTPVTYNGQNFRPQDLERGDEVLVRVAEAGTTLVAESMTVTYNVASGSSTYPGGSSASNVRGTVRYVDTSRRTIEVEQTNGSIVTVDYETNTPVTFNNQSYRASDLERGDQIDIRVRNTGSNRFVAEQINVTRSISDNGTRNDSNSASTIRGTVRYVDTSRRTIELESTSWRSNFDTRTGTGSGSGRVIVSYDTNTNVDVSGRLYPVSGLERGDVIDVQVQNPNATNPFAQRIILVRNVSQ